MLGSSGLEEEGIFGFRSGGDLEVCGGWSDEVGGDLSVNWDEIGWVWFGGAGLQEILDRLERWLELVLVGLSIRYDDNQSGTLIIMLTPCAIFAVIYELE